MKKHWEKIKQEWLFPSGCYFIVVLFVFFAFLKLSMPDGTIGLTVRDTLCLLGYSVGLSAAKFLLQLDMGAITRYILHAAASLVDFIVFVLLLTGHLSGKGFTGVMISIIYFVGYIIVMVVRGFVLSAKKEEENQKKEYSNRFLR